MGDDLSILLAFLSEDKYSLLAPITKMGKMILERELSKLKNIKSYKTEKELLEDLPIKLELLSELILTTYIGKSKD